jgi:predicted TIM-barrel fold metal-dependent hydrolase
MIDVFNHILPPEFVAAVDKQAKRRPFMFDRALTIPAMAGVDARLQAMDLFPNYQQILSLSSPTVEAFAPHDDGIELAQVGNDALAKLVAEHPDRFPGFIATLPIANPAAAIREAERAVQQLGAVGVQLYTNVGGEPIDRPDRLEVFGCMAELRRPVWLHPLLTMSTPDYPNESVSKYDLWWAFGWPHETSVAMGRLVFAGVFDRWPQLKVITHHGGGTIPMCEGRIEHGLMELGTRNGPDMAHAVATNLQEPPLTAFHRFYADTATFGSRAALQCACDFFGLEKMLFASDMPFGPDQGTGAIGETLRCIDALGLSESERNSILRTNFERLLK